MLSNQVTPLRSVDHLEHLLKASHKTLKDLITNSEGYYKPKEVITPKPDGKIKVRFLDRPFGQLKNVQGRIHSNYLVPIAGYFPKGMLGGIPGRSHLNNIDIHKQQEVLVTMDIKKCFPSTGDHKVHKALMDHLGCGRRVAHILTDLTTRNGHIPQGAPTSNLILNLAILDLYKELASLLTPRGLQLSLTVDDFAFSGEALTARGSMAESIGLIMKHGYGVKSSKTRVMSKSRPQIVTGILVNHEGRVPKPYYEKLRVEIISLAKRGITTEKALASLSGKVNYVDFMDHKQGARLYLLGQRALGLDLSSWQS